jgi:hypothetical protein
MLTAWSLPPRRLLRPVLLALMFLTACSSWRVQPVAPAELIGQQHPDQVRLRRHDGRQVVVKQPLVRSDSVIAQVPRDSTAVPLSDVSAIAVRRFDWLKTTGLVVLVTGATLGVACAAACQVGPNFSFNP